MVGKLRDTVKLSLGVEAALLTRVVRLVDVHLTTQHIHVIVVLATHTLLIQNKRLQCHLAQTIHLVVILVIMGILILHVHLKPMLVLVVLNLMIHIVINKNISSNRTDILYFSH